jgi:hypothetical protein
MELFNGSRIPVCKQELDWKGDTQMKVNSKVNAGGTIHGE